jgi:hypothetical protein
VTDLICPTCGGFVLGAEGAHDGERVSVRCSRCGSEIRYWVGSPAATTRIAANPAAGPAAPAAGHPAGEPEALADPPDGASTLFRPDVLVPAREAAGEEPEERTAERGPPPVDAGSPSDRLDRTVLASASTVAPPPLRVEGRAYFLLVGAVPGRERIPVPAARTVFGREGADVDLGDPTVSSRHFQVEAAGREFFIRDLQSRNGTFVNGRRLRYAELLPGDEVLAGSTYLVFRTSDDGLGGRGTGDP